MTQVRDFKEDVPVESCLHVQIHRVPRGEAFLWRCSNLRCGAGVVGLDNREVLLAHDRRTVATDNYIETLNKRLNEGAASEAQDITTLRLALLRQQFDAQREEFSRVVAIVDRLQSTLNL